MSQIGSFKEIASVLGIASLLGFVGQKFRQPLVIMFLATGIVAGPSALGLIQSHAQIELLAQIGIALLLFIVGLKLDLKLIRTTGPVALATGVGQIVFTSLIGFAIAMLLGMSVINAAYLAVALTFSSTIIIVKLLSDKKEIDSLHGQIALGFLIVQDIAAILALVFLTTFGSQLAGEGSILHSTLLILGRGTALIAVIGLLMRFVIPGLVERLAKSPELLSLFAVSWAVLLGAGGEMLGFSKEVGAFLAGVSLASTDYRDAIGARLTGLRDFLLLFFFIDLGARLDWSTVGAQIGNSVIFSLFVLIGNPIIVLIIMGLMGYRRRTSFMAGLTVAQISEFSLIVAAIGLGLGHITPETMGLITLVGVVTIFVSTYMILYSGQLYKMLSGPLKVFERKNPYREAEIDSVQQVPDLDVILFGLGGYGSNLAEDLINRKKIIMGVDFDPEALQKWRNRGISLLYGDISDHETLENLPIGSARCVASTIHSEELNTDLLNLLRSRGFQGKIAVTASNIEEAKRYEQAGVDIVFRPFSDAAEQAAGALEHAMDILPSNLDWPIAFRNVKIRAGSAYACKKVKEIPLRSVAGVSILAVIRAGRLYHEPGADFTVYPGDQLVIMGRQDSLAKAESLLAELSATEAGEDAGRFEVTQIHVESGSPYVGATLMNLKFRQTFGVTVIGVNRGETQITTPGPDFQLEAGDCVVVIGTGNAVEALNEKRLLTCAPALS